MKKLVLASLLMSLVFSTNVMASSTDFSFIKEYSDEELLLLREELNNEILGRTIETYADLVPSNYEIGIDLPAGRYMLSNVTEEESCNFINYCIYQDMESYKADPWTHIADGTVW